MIEKPRGRGRKLTDFGEWSRFLATVERQVGQKWTTCLSTVKVAGLNLALAP
jgi:hypothetical protein